jgi:hypothetical protein
MYADAIPSTSFGDQNTKSFNRTTLSGKAARPDG